MKVGELYFLRSDRELHGNWAEVFVRKGNEYRYVADFDGVSVIGTRYSSDFIPLTETEVETFTRNLMMKRMFE